MTINGKEKVMVACMAVLIIFMASIFLRLGTRMVLVKKLHMDNVVTRTVLFDKPDMQITKVKGADYTIVDMHWPDKYPFADMPWAEKNKIKQKVAVFASKIDTLKKKNEEWTTLRLPFYQDFVDIGMKWNRIAGWDFISTVHNVYKFSDGYFTYVSGIDKYLQERVDSISRLSRYVESYGGKFIYVQNPGKTNKYADEELKARDFANNNADMLLEGLAKNHVATFDMRPELRQAVGDAGWHGAFFRTDHHWEPRTALWAAGVIARKLQQDYQVDVNLEHLSPKDYRTEHYDKWFLGSQGRKVTLANTEPDDFELYYPLFDTKLHWQIPSLGIDKEGDFSIMYDMSSMGNRDYYNSSPYHVYGYGDKDLVLVHNYNNESLQDKKILIIRDSFLDTESVFLSMALKDITLLDIRHFDGSLESYIQQKRPDIVMVMYTLPGGGAIDFNDHKGTFNFR